MIKVCVVTTARSEYGLLKNLLTEINIDKTLELQLVVTGSHLSSQYGNTVNYIIKDGFNIHKTIDIMLSENSKLSNAKSMGIALISFSEYFAQYKPDMLVVLGDRYEILPICSSALMFNIPIAHISGGEVTEGAIDDAIRNAVSKMSNLHFPGCDAYRKRLIQMGESPDSVFSYGDIGVEQISKISYLSEQDCRKKYSLKGKYYIVIFHPVTYEGNCYSQVCELVKFINNHKEEFIIIKPNSDTDSSIINNELLKLSEQENIHYFSSLPYEEYLSLLKYSSGIIGNSSSGIVEAPSLETPTINIGNRQKGRLLASSIVNCECNHMQIEQKFNEINDDGFKNKINSANNPYALGETSKGIVKEIKKYISNHKSCSKKFYDIKFEVNE